MNPPRAREVIFSVTAIFIGLLLAFIIVESLLRIFTPEWLAFRMNEINPDSESVAGSDRDWPVVEINDEFKSFVPFASFNIEHFEYRNLATIDELGGRRTRSFDDWPLIPFLGDSFTFGVGVNDDQTYINLLAGPGLGRFVNLGAPGIALNKELDILQLRHRELQNPQIYVLTVFAGNDFADLYNYYTRTLPQKSRRGHRENENDPSMLFKINRFVYRNPLTKHLYSVQFLRQKVLLLLNRNNPQHMNPVFLEARTDTPYLQEANRYFMEQLRRLKEMSRKLNFSFLFIILPDVHQIDRTLMEVKAEYYGIAPETLDLKMPNKLLARNFLSEDIPFIDISTCLESHDQSNRLYYRFDTHLTAYGHLAVARCLKENGFHQLLRAAVRR